MPTPRHRPRMLLLGNSHVQMVSAAHAIAGNRGYDFESHWLKSRRHGNMTIEEAETRIATLGEDDLLILTRLGAQHNVLGLFEHDQGYCVFDPVSDPRLEAVSKAPIPVSALRAEFADLCARDSVMNRLCAVRPCRIIHYGAPPPKPRFDRSFKLREIDGKMMRFEFNDPVTRLAMWKIEAEAVSARIAALKIEECLVPPQTVDAQGYLTEPYSARDITHANDAYGRLLLDYFEIVLFSNGRGPTTTSRKEE